MSDCPANFLSFDVEECNVIETFQSLDPFTRSTFDRGRVVANTLKLLEILGKFDKKATFFVLGDVAKKYPHLVLEISKVGHEVASHGFNHIMINQQTPQEFRDDIRHAKNILEDITGESILGYRAPTFSITPKTEWAIDILNEESYVYDSSIYPIMGHDRYGYPNAPLKPYRHVNGLIEFPLATFQAGPLKIPFGGGGYFRLYPYFVTRRLINLNNKRKIPVTVYLHPWEIDSEQEKAKLPLLSRYRTYNHINKVHNRLKRLLADFNFCPLRDKIKQFTDRAVV